MWYYKIKEFNNLYNSTFHYNIFSMFEQYLQSIGLNQKEAKIYLALLEVESASVIEISKKTKINRTTVYTLLESLSKKGLVSETAVGKKTQYQAESPERLETFIERQKIEFEEKAKKAKDVISQLKSIHRESGTRPTVRYFEGKEGIISANEELYSVEPDGSPVYLLYSRDNVDNIFTKKEQENFRNTRLKKNIKSKVLYTQKDGYKPSDKTGDRIKIDGKKYPIHCDISIYVDTVRISIIGEKKLSAIYVQSPEFAETLKSLFNLTFDKLKEAPDR